jgi:predicted deacylase
MGSPKVKETRAIKFTAAGHEIEIPVLIARGAKPGKTLVVSAGVHGDEFEGVRAIFDTFRHIDTAAMSGNLIAVPVANPPAGTARQASMAAIARSFRAAMDRRGDCLLLRSRHPSAGDLYSICTARA